jgi:hypothetical protein
MPKVRDLMDILKNDFDPEDVIAYSLWTKKDVESLIGQENTNRHYQDQPEIYFESEDVDQILENMHDQYDPEQGLNDDSLFSAYLDVAGDREEVHEEEEVSIF